MLGRNFPASSWIHECGALEIEIHARSGKPAEPKATDDDDLKLLALNSLMKVDEPRALGQIQEILNGSDASDKLRKEAQFILGQHYSNVTYPQVVRISSLEGDVRVSRGKKGSEQTGAEWEKAVADLPLETGYSLATGEGRAEIEFEDASTLYLGENSVLVFNDLHETAGAPYTDIALLTGTVTLHVHPYVANELFLLKTPTDTLITRYPEKFYARLTSFLDGIAVTPEAGGVIHLPALTQEQILKGQTLYYRDSKRIDPPASADQTQFAAWDAWVAGRIAQRDAANAQMMEASGRTEPIPGLAEMNGLGHFFDCAPYGTCWEPDQFPAAPSESDPQSTAAQEGSAAIAQNQESADASKAGTLPAKRILAEFFPCMPPAIRYRLSIEALAAGNKQAAFDPYLYPYAWGVCHSGGWTRHRNHYVWVVGHRRHHLTPVRWVKSGRTVAFIPIHPFDVKGRPAINRSEVVFALNEKSRLGFEPLQLSPSKPLELLDQPPREFRRTVLMPLNRAEEPHLMAHKVENGLSSKSSQAKLNAIPLTFDHKTQSFVAPHQEMRDGHSVTVVAPITNHGGNLQSHSGFSGGGAGGSHGATSSGGGSHSGGGSGGGGSSAHSSASSTTASNSSSASSASGSHK